MSFQLALCSFEFDTVRGFTYDANEDHNFAVDDPPLGQAIQPVVQEAYKLIKKCMSNTISSSFYFGTSQLQNINNLLHIGTSTLDAYVGNIEGLNGRMSLLFIAKFYRLEPHRRFKVTLDIEEMPSTLMNWSGREYMIKMREYGISNKHLFRLVSLLDDKFQLNGRIEYTPFIRRGRLDLPRYLLTSDERVIEYDFDKLLYHEKSDYQDIKIVTSPSLGNVLLLDNLQNMSEADDSYTLELMAFPLSSMEDKDILILGGGDGALLHELIKRNPKHVTMIEIDIKVIEACQLYLKPWGSVFDKMEGPNYKIIIEDCLKQLRQFANARRKFDIVFNDLTDRPLSKRDDALNAFDPSSKQRDNPWHFIETIFNLSIDCLKEKVGVYMTHATGKGNVESIEAFEKFLRTSCKRVEFEWREAFVPSFMETWRFYSIKRRDPDQEDRQPSIQKWDPKPRVIFGNPVFEDLIKRRHEQTTNIEPSSLELIN